MRELGIRIAAVALAYVALAMFFDGRVWWLGAGLTCGVVIGMFTVIWLLPPWDVAKWGVGAEGERWTEDVLSVLEGEGWEVEHDLERDRGNDDHLVLGPAGVYLLETKTLRGVVALENGILTTVSVDDPENVYRWRSLAADAKRRAKSISAKIRRDAHVREWVQPVVVIWGNFAAPPTVLDDVVYLHGSQLADWLRSRSQTRDFLTLKA